MRSKEQIEIHRKAICIVAANNSPVPDIVRERARDIATVLSWVLKEKDDECISPYYLLAGCCCIKEKTFLESVNKGELSMAHLELGCALGVDMCLCPNNKKHYEDPPNVGEILKCN